MRGGFRSIAERFGGVVKEQAAKAIDKSSSVVSDAASTAYEKGKSSAVKTARRASKEVSGRVERVYAQGKSATIEQVTSATKRASHVVRDTSSTIAANAAEAAKEAAKEAKQEATKGIRMLWWWSLAAIGIYGIATTVPRELVRHALNGRNRQQIEDSNNVKETAAPEEPRSKTISSWIGSIGRSS